MTKLALIAVAAIALQATPLHAMSADEKAVDDLGKTFALGFWEKSPEQVLSTVHPDISKKGLEMNWNRSGSTVMESLPPDRLQVLGWVYNYDDHLKDAEGPRVIIHEISNNVASIEMVNSDWYDFFHAVKLNGEWTLLNCVYGGAATYENKDAENDSAAINAVLADYIAGLAGDADKLDRVLHVNLERREFGETKSGKTYIAPLAREALIMDAGALDVKAEKARFEVHNFTNQVAAARIDAGPWSEQVQLLKINGQWSIVNSFVL